MSQEEKDLKEVYEDIKKTDDLIKEIDKVLEQEDEREEEEEEEEEEKGESVETRYLFIILLMKFAPYIEISTFFWILQHVHLDFNLLLVFFGVYMKGITMLPKPEKGFLKNVIESLTYALVYNLCITFFLLTFIYHLMEQSYTSFHMVLLIGILHIFITCLVLYFKRKEIFYVHFMLIMMFPVNDPVYLGWGSSLQRLTMGNLLFALDIYFVKMVLGMEYVYVDMINMLIPVWKTPIIMMYIYVFVYITYRVSLVYHKWDKVLRALEKFKKRVVLGLVGGSYSKVGEEEEEDVEEEEDEDVEEEGEFLPPFINKVHAEQNFQSGRGIDARPINNNNRVHGNNLSVVNLYHPQYMRHIQGKEKEKEKDIKHSSIQSGASFTSSSSYTPNRYNAAPMVYGRGYVSSVPSVPSPGPISAPALQKSTQVSIVQGEGGGRGGGGRNRGVDNVGSFF